MENGGCHNLVNLIRSQNESEESLKDIHHLTIPRKEILLSSQIDLCIEETKPKIPDGGWGWLVVIGCFFINLISDGVSSTFGLLNIEFLNEFQASNSATSLIGSLFLSVPLLAGPLGSALVDRYGCKYMTVLGGSICTIGFIISAYVRNIWLMYLTFGIIGGIGFCFCFVAAVVSIAFWFEKRRTLVLGFAASGTGFGTVIYSPLLTYLLGEYGWRGAMLIMAAIGANMCVSGLLMRDPEWVIEEERKACKKQKEKLKKPKKLLVPKINYEIEGLKTSLSQRCSSSLIELPTFIHEHQEVPLEALRKLSDNKKLYNIILENYPNLLSCKSASETIFLSDKSLNDIDSLRVKAPLKFCMTLKETETLASHLCKTMPGGCPEFQNSLRVKAPLKFCMTLKETETLENEVKPDNNQSEHGRIPLLRSDSSKSRGHQSHQHHNYLKNIRFRKNSMGYRGAMLNLHKYKLAASSCPTFYKNSDLSDAEDDEEEWYDDYVEVLKDITNLSLFNDLHFLLLGVSTVITCIWFVVPFFYLPVHMTLFGYTEHQASFVLSVIGLTNIIGMVFFAVIGDKLNIVKVYALCLIGCGLTSITMMLFTSNYVLLILSCGFFGLFFASVYALTPAILGDLVPLDKFTMAYGMFLLCQGIGNLAGPPIAGLLYDLTQSYEQSFYQAGFWVIFSGILVGFIPYTENRKIVKSNNKCSR